MQLSCEDTLAQLLLMHGKVFIDLITNAASCPAQVLTQLSKLSLLASLAGKAPGSDTP